MNIERENLRRLVLSSKAHKERNYFSYAESAQGEMRKGKLVLRKLFAGSRSYSKADSFPALLETMSRKRQSPRPLTIVWAVTFSSFRVPCISLVTCRRNNLNVQAL